MVKKDRDFLLRADRVSENYERRIAKLRERIAETVVHFFIGGLLSLATLPILGFCEFPKTVPASFFFFNTFLCL